MLMPNTNINTLKKSQWVSADNTEHKSHLMLIKGEKVLIL